MILAFSTGRSRNATLLFVWTAGLGMMRPQIL
jgi:hypothetical protein